MADLYSVLKDIDRARNWVLAYMDNQGFDTQVFLVAASGFLTDSYALFATNIILPSLTYIYWPDSTDNRHQLAINCVTLAGSVCGQALFGYLADKYGRRKLYGVELIIVIFGTLGMAQASTGANKSMSILWWIIFWRFFMGLGIGAGSHRCRICIYKLPSHHDCLCLLDAAVGTAMCGGRGLGRTY